MSKKLSLLILLLGIPLVFSCERTEEPDTLVSAAIGISVDNVLTSSAEVTVFSKQDNVVSCIISLPQKYEEVADYLDMDAVDRYDYIREHGSEHGLEPVLFRKLDPTSKYFVGAMGLDADGNVITAPVFMTFETGSMNVRLNAVYTGMTESGKYRFSASVTPDEATAEYMYLFDESHVASSKEELTKYILSEGEGVKKASGKQDITLESDSRMVIVAVIPFDMDGNMGELATMVAAGEMTLVTVDLNGVVALESREDNENIYEGVVDVPSGAHEFTVTVNGVQYGAVPYSGVAGVGTFTEKEYIAYPAVGIRQDGSNYVERPLTYTVSKSIGRMSAVSEGGRKFWTNTDASEKMTVRIDLSYKDRIPRYYFRVVDAPDVILHESFDLFAYSGDYMKPANGCSVEMTPDAVDGTEPGVMQPFDLTNANGANKNEVGYMKTHFDYPDLENGKVLASELYIRNRDMEGWTILSCGEKVGAIQLSVSTAKAFGVLTTPCLEKINGTEDVILEIDMARFSTSSKNKIAVRIEGDGEFSSGEVTVDGQEKVDLTEAVASKKEYHVGNEKSICPPSVANGDLDKPVSHFRFGISGASPKTRISIDSSVDANEKGDNSGASRCFVFDLKVTR